MHPSEPTRFQPFVQVDTQKLKRDAEMITEMEVIVHVNEVV
jgi:hypothetical protein